MRIAEQKHFQKKTIIGTFFRIDARNISADNECNDGFESASTTLHGGNSNRITMNRILMPCQLKR